MDTTERLAHPSGDQDGESGRGAVRRATALAGLGSVADVAAVAQLLTTESRQGVNARTTEGNLVGIRFPVIPANSDAPLRISYVVWHATTAE